MIVETSIPRPALLFIGASSGSVARQRLCYCAARSGGRGGRGGARDELVWVRDPLVLQTHRAKGSPLGAMVKRTNAALPGGRALPLGGSPRACSGAPGPGRSAAAGVGARGRLAAEREARSHQRPRRPAARGAGGGFPGSANPPATLEAA